MCIRDSATADDELRPVMNGIYFDITTEDITMVASDGHKLVRCKTLAAKGNEMCIRDRAYAVVGPICESSDVFGKAIDLNGVKRGDLIALRSAGAYGEIMASGYNCRELPQGYTSDELV